MRGSRLLERYAFSVFLALGRNVSKSQWLTAVLTAVGGSLIPALLVVVGYGWLIHQPDLPATVDPLGVIPTDGFFAFLVLLVLGMTCSGWFMALRIWLKLRRNAQAKARLAKIEALQAKLQVLSQTSPELTLALDILREEQVAQQDLIGRKAFWLGMLQNFVFFILGVITPVVLSHLSVH